MTRVTALGGHVLSLQQACMATAEVNGETVRSAENEEDDSGEGFQS